MAIQHGRDQEGAVAAALVLIAEWERMQR